MTPAEQISRQFYRQLCHSACKDIHVKAGILLWCSLCKIVRHYTFNHDRHSFAEILCLSQLQGFKINLGLCNAIGILLVFYSIPQSLEANWRRGHSTLTRLNTGSGVLCLQYDEKKMVTGHTDSAIKVCNCWCVSFPT